MAQNKNVAQGCEVCPLIAVEKHNTGCASYRAIKVATKRERGRVMEIIYMYNGHAFTERAWKELRDTLGEEKSVKEETNYKTVMPEYIGHEDSIMERV